MSRYVENPKTEGSGILCAIPQSSRCPNNCKDCYFQSGRSYLEPLSKNLPNMPPIELASKFVVRVNDGNDSNIEFDKVIRMTKDYPNKFYNTAMPKNLDKFNAPVVLTVNPGEMTDSSAYYLEEIPETLMFVRARTNTWNLHIVDKIVGFYTAHGVPVILTFMAYWQYAESIPAKHAKHYIERKRTENRYLAITSDAWNSIMVRYENNILVRSCGTEGEKGTTKCKHCGNCLREYFATLVRMENSKDNQLLK